MGRSNARPSVPPIPDVALDRVPVLRIPYSRAPSAEAARYPGLGTVAGKPAYLDAKRKTLADFKALLTRLPAVWKTHRLDQFVPAQGLYVDDNRDVRREADDVKVGQLPTLAADKNVVLVAAEDFEPADEAWTYLSSLVGKASTFPGRGGTVVSTINGITSLLAQVDAKYGAMGSSSKWLWIGLAAVGAVVLWSYFGKGRH